MKKESKRLLSEAEQIAGARIVTADVPDVPLAELRRLADSVRSSPDPVAGVLATGDGGKVHLLAFASESLVQGKGLNAGALIKEIAPIVGGGGGGRPEFAQAGGRDAAHIPDALRKASELIKGWVTGTK